MPNIYIEGSKTQSDTKETRVAATAALKLIEDFFNFDPTPITIHLFYNRHEFDTKTGQKTTGWIAGHSKGKSSEVYIFAPSAYGQSCHQAEEKFSKTLTHEMIHLAISKLTNDKNLPMWLGEGLAFFLAEQVSEEAGVFIDERGVCRSLDTYQEWHENVDYGVYNLAGKFVGFLIDRYGKAKLLKLLAAAEKNYVAERFEKIFEKVYGKNIGVVEKEFAASL